MVAKIGRAESLLEYIASSVLKSTLNIVEQTPAALSLSS